MGDMVLLLLMTLRRLLMGKEEQSTRSTKLEMIVKIPAIKGEKGNLENVLGSCDQQMTDRVRLGPGSPASPLHSSPLPQLGDLLLYHMASPTAVLPVSFSVPPEFIKLHSVVPGILSSLVHSKTVLILLLCILFPSRLSFPALSLP